MLKTVNQCVDIREMYKLIVEHYDISGVVSRMVFENKSCTLLNTGWLMN